MNVTMITPLVLEASWGIYRSSLVGWLVGFLTSSSTTRLYRGRAPRQSVRQFYVLPHMRQSWETMTSVSAGHIILTPTQPVGSGRPQRESNPGPPHQESRALPTELPRPHHRSSQFQKCYSPTDHLPYYNGPYILNAMVQNYQIQKMYYYCCC